MSKSALIKSSLAKKYWMAATGLFLCLFLIGHLAGNTLLLWPEHEIEPDRAGALAFNSYAAFMTTNPVIKILSYLTYFSILFHAIDGILLVIQNRKARPVNYAYNKPAANSSWASRNMGLLGAVLVFYYRAHALFGMKCILENLEKLTPIRQTLLTPMAIKTYIKLPQQHFNNYGMLLCMGYV